MKGEKKTQSQPQKSKKTKTNKIQKYKLNK